MVNNIFFSLYQFIKGHTRYGTMSHGMILTKEHGLSDLNLNAVMNIYILNTGGLS